MEIKRRKFKLSDVNWRLIVPVAILVLMSLNIILDVNGLESAISQTSWAALSFGAFLLCAAIDYKSISRYAIILYVISLISLILVLFTPPINGARSWFKFGGMSLQPSEFTKPALILLLATYLPFRDFYKSLPGLLPPLAFTLIPFSLVILQPDLGTALVFIPIFLVVVLIAGVKKRHILVLVLITILASPLMYLFLEEHQKNRIRAFIWPQRYKKTVNRHLDLAKTSIGAGGFAGFTPEDEGSLPHKGYIRYAVSDYIYAVVGEKYGFLGSVFVLMLYLYVFFELFLVVVSARHPNERLIAAGVFASLASQSLIHIGGNLDLIPFTGVPLPFMSAGGSSLMSCTISLALVVNVCLRRKTFLGKERSDVK